ncbi:hypothetical protein [Litoreibacter roseus]|uniref:Uncharacterized protein n=1 Tax=Litoreibacter roseus TaxID=2601869 RepID=A0A6N6JIQ8_9RHOB|nr:hypothetical protein [Litoreibacter roseus]GFE65710.1 hypothetical protein KIN_27840 [Litoreibacter roseus]
MLTRLCSVALSAAIAFSVPAATFAQDATVLSDASRYTQATHRRIVEMRFDLPPAEIIPLLLTRVDLFDPTIAEVHFDHSQSENPGTFGVGSRRICIFDDGRELVEPIILYDPPHAYGYTVDVEASTLSLPVSEIVLLYDFGNALNGGTNLSVHAFYDPKIPGTGIVIEPVLTGTLRRTFQTATDVFGGTYLGDEKP